MNTPVRSSLPPVDPGIYWIERLRGSQKISFTVYSPALWGFDTHYNNGRTRLCFEDHDQCIGGHDEATLRWTGYLFGWLHHKNQRAFVQITEGGARKLVNQVAKGTSFRGMELEIWKTKADNGRQNILVRKHAINRGEDLPPDIDPLRSLCKLMDIPLQTLPLSRSLVQNVDDLGFPVEAAGVS